jgi:hypothetical protein
MKKLSRIRMLVAALTVTSGMALPALPALGGTELVFRGYAKYVSGSPDELGAVMEIYGVLERATGTITPIDVDLQNNEYTIAVTGMTVTDAFDQPSPSRRIISYGAGQLHIYAQPIGTGTAADFGLPGTFTDGEMLLGGDVRADCIAELFDFDDDGDYSGSAYGGADFDAGTRLSAMEAAGYDLTDWNFNGTLADPDAGAGVTVPAGYDRVFDILLTPPREPSPVEAASWGRIKNLYQ